jgi:very-short-patch-repair endonuclease
MMKDCTQMTSEVLVDLLKAKSDLAILQSEGWYRIPVEHRPSRWPPEYIAFYQASIFGKDAFCIRHYGRVSKISKASRAELFPHKPWGEKADKVYYRIEIEKLEELTRAIPSRLPRRLVFIPITWKKFFHAEELNDLFDDSPLEDDIWAGLKTAAIHAERQWLEQVGDNFYLLDFAIFCNDGKIDVEADGDTWHARTERISQDNDRNNDLAKNGWNILRFNGKKIHEEQPAYLAEIKDTINRCGGLVDDGLVARRFIEKGGDSAQQLSLFSGKPPAK